jgi:hypothetical protein
MEQKFAQRGYRAASLFVEIETSFLWKREVGSGRTTINQHPHHCCSQALSKNETVMMNLITTKKVEASSSVFL